MSFVFNFCFIGNGFSTYLFYLSGKFEISVDALRIIESTIDEDGIPSSQLFQLDCGQYNYQCGYVEKDE
jgi:hypothetical protein